MGLVFIGIHWVYYPKTQPIWDLAGEVIISFDAELPFELVWHPIDVRYVAGTRDVTRNGLNGMNDDNAKMFLGHI